MTEPHTIAKYDILARIAQGGMGNVYLARTQALAGFTKLVVVKTLRSDFADDPKFCAMFLDEARLAARLSHRNVVQTNDAGVDNGTYYMVMDYLDGRNLWRIQKQFAKEDRQIPLAVSVRIVADMLAGLHHAHELADFDGKTLGVVHRDVCPANVFVTIDGQVKVVDFGVAKAKNHVHETQAGTIKGRVVYMSPEHVSSAAIDRRADVFSAGIILWEALEGRRFWDGGGETQVLGRLLEGRLPPPPGDDRPALLREACIRALAHKADDRFPTAHAMRLALEEWLEHNEIRNGLTDLGASIKEITATDRARVALLAEGTRATASEPVPALEPTIAPPPGVVAGASVAPGPSASIPSTTAPYTPQPVTNTTVSPAPTSPSSVRRAWPAVAAGLVVVALLAGWQLGKSSEKTATSASTAAAPSSTPSAVTSPPSVTEVSPPVSAPPTGNVSLDVSISPLTAKVFLDDRPLGANPFHGQLARDGKSHVLRAESAGFRPRAFSFVLDRDRAVDFALEAYPVSAHGGPPTPTKSTGKAGEPSAPAGEPTGIHELPLKDNDPPKPQLDTDVFKKP